MMNYDELRELLDDAPACARLTKWEHEFIADIKNGGTDELSPRQLKKLKDIQEKVYAT